MNVQAYYSLGLCGYEIELNDAGDSVTYRFVAVTGGEEHKSKVYFTQKGRAYFKAGTRRIYLDECIRTNI